MGDVADYEVNDWRMAKHFARLSRDEGRSEEAAGYERAAEKIAKALWPHLTAQQVREIMG